MMRWHETLWRSTPLLFLRQAKTLPKLLKSFSVYSCRWETFKTFRRMPSSIYKELTPFFPTRTGRWAMNLQNSSGESQEWSRTHLVRWESLQVYYRRQQLAKLKAFRCSLILQIYALKTDYLTKLWLILKRLFSWNRNRSTLTSHFLSFCQPWTEIKMRWTVWMRRK